MLAFVTFYLIRTKYTDQYIHMQGREDTMEAN